MPTNINTFEIVGGNHGNFGNYGAQQGEGAPKFYSFERQAITVEKIKEILGGKS